MKPASPPERGRSQDRWDECTWEGARMATLLEGARLSMIEKLEWLEQVERLGEVMRAQSAELPKRRP